MHALQDNITSRQSEQVAAPAHRPASSLVSSWAERRRQLTPWAYPRLRALGVTRLAIGAFLVVVGTVLTVHSHVAWGAIPLVGAAVLFTIGGLDLAAGLSASHRS
jgi:hypothetical protein